VQTLPIFAHFHPSLVLVVTNLSIPKIFIIGHAHVIGKCDLGFKEFDIAMDIILSK